MSRSISVVVNGEAREVPEGLSVTDLLTHLGIASGRVAVERNLVILPRQEWAVRQVSEGDRYEIVHLVGGG